MRCSTFNIGSVILKVLGSGFWVQGSGFRVQRFRVQGSGFKGSGFRVQRFRVQGSKVQGSGFKGSRFRATLLRSQCSGFRCQSPGSKVQRLNHSRNRSDVMSKDRGEQAEARGYNL
jgi:hypothetical protein